MAVDPFDIAGKLRHRIAFQKAVDTVDKFGAPTAVYQTVATVWAAIEPLTGKEYLTMKSIGASESHKITIRYLADIDPSMRIAYPPSSATRLQFDSSFNTAFSNGGPAATQIHFGINSIADIQFRKRVMIIMATQVLSPVSQ